MLPEYSDTKSDSLAQMSTPKAEIQNFFCRGLFFIGAPCRSFSHCYRLHLDYFDVAIEKRR